MNQPDMDRLLSSAFDGGALRRRELRLDPRDAEYAAQTGAEVRVLADAGDKQWYEITYKEAAHGN